MDYNVIKWLFDPKAWNFNTLSEARLLEDVTPFWQYMYFTLPAYWLVVFVVQILSSLPVRHTLSISVSAEVQILFGALSRIETNRLILFTNMVMSPMMHLHPLHWIMNSVSMYTCVGVLSELMTCDDVWILYWQYPLFFAGCIGGALGSYNLTLKHGPLTVGASGGTMGLCLVLLVYELVVYGFPKDGSRLASYISFGIMAVIEFMPSNLDAMKSLTDNKDCVGVSDFAAHAMGMVGSTVAFGIMGLLYIVCSKKTMSLIGLYSSTVLLAITALSVLATLIMMPIRGKKRLRRFVVKQKLRLKEESAIGLYVDLSEINKGAFSDDGLFERLDMNGETEAMRKAGVLFQPSKFPKYGSDCC